MTGGELERRLIALGYNADVAKACGQLFGTLEEAKQYLGPPGLLPNTIKEYYSLKFHRYYYCNSETDSTSWDLPPQLQLSEWMLDASLSGLDVCTCRKLLSCLVWAVGGNSHKGEVLWSALGVLAKLTGNVVACGNTLEKYRTIKLTNPRIREALDSLGGGGSAGEAVLAAAGFVRRGDTMEFPEGGDMRPLVVVDGKLQQLVGRKGFTGLSRDNDDRGASTASRHAGTPGFRYQREIHECSHCAKPINDGSDRLVTRKHDAPKGEFRYQCEACQDYSLCEACWDSFMDGRVSHPREHPFRTHHPRVAAHNLVSAESDANPWGVVLSGGSAARARERLKNRTGL